MMKNFKHIVSAAFMLVCAAASAQNFNPTVEVTNAYQGASAVVNKPQLEMNIPDSLLRFDFNFDYEVFDKPYEGSYSFKPYMLNLTPAKDAYRGHKLYLKAGAGYSLHPQFDFVFSPDRKGPLQLSLYASHRSYFGNYADIVTEALPEGGQQFVASTKTWKGYDALTKVGFDGRYSMEKAVVTFGAGYYGLLAKDTLANRSYNALDFNVGIKSNSNASKYFFYDVNFNGRLGMDAIGYVDNYKPLSIGDQTLKVSEGVFALHGDVGPVFNPTNRVLVGIDAISARCGNMMDNNSGLVALTPRYVLDAGRFSFTMGARIELLTKGQNDAETFGQMHTKKGNIIYPAVNVTFSPSQSVLFYAKATGGTDLNTYSSLIDANHHLTPAFYSRDMYSVDNTVEAVNARLGVKANLWKHLQLDLSGGYAMIENGLRESWRTALFGSSPIIVPCIDYQDYNMAFADALFALRAGRVRMDAGLHYKKSFYSDSTQPYKGFELPAFTADSKIVLDFNKRVYAGLLLLGSTCRKFNDDKIPGYIDLGVIGGYQITRKFGVWLESSNLLCETIQRNLMYAEKGPWVTVGIALTL